MSEIAMEFNSHHRSEYGKRSARKPARSVWSRGKAQALPIVTRSAGNTKAWGESKGSRGGCLRRRRASNNMGRVVPEHIAGPMPKRSSRANSLPRGDAPDLAPRGLSKPQIAIRACRDAERRAIGRGDGELSEEALGGDA